MIFDLVLLSRLWVWSSREPGPEMSPWTWVYGGGQASPCKTIIVAKLKTLSIYGSQNHHHHLRFLLVNLWDIDTCWCSVSGIWQLLLRRHCDVELHNGKKGIQAESICHCLLLIKQGPDLNELVKWDPNKAIARVDEWHFLCYSKIHFEGEILRNINILKTKFVIEDHL